MSWSYKEQLKHLEVQVNNIRKGVNILMIRDPRELTATLNNRTKEKDLKKYIGQVEHELEQVKEKDLKKYIGQLEHELEQVEAITGRSNSFTLGEIIDWLWNELELAEDQNKRLIEARLDNDTVAEQELVRQITGGSSSDKVTAAISYLDKFQKCIEKELDRLMDQSPRKIKCLPYCW